ncbi:hypothetical protein CCH79_00011393 [Gambusia affinis]|uniref:Selenoprotein P N-terminal domain-containing protein n=1 Tax=Gambusia affinis TaxID=33528 RepID=A0A315V1Z1_GAMAF|nr:hypothetical protein CCH79_00011393 [Gambusia affinis]
MIVNEQNAVSRALYWTLKKRAPTGVPVYQQEANQTDVWEVLDGDKDDFLIYDRCGLLTFHVVLPYSFLHTPYVEAAIRATYVGDICNCSVSDSTFGEAHGRTQTGGKKNRSNQYRFRGDIETVSTQGTVEPPDEGVDPTEMTQPIPHHYHHPSSFFHHQPPPPKMPQDQDQDRSVWFPDPHYQHNLHFHRRHK